jgi:hypothetical protein
MNSMRRGPVLPVSARKPLLRSMLGQVSWSQIHKRAGRTDRSMRVGHTLQSVGSNVNAVSALTFAACQRFDATAGLCPAVQTGLPRAIARGPSDNWG